MMRLLYCIDSLASSGGTERVLTTKLNWLSEREDVKVYIFTLKEENAPFFKLSDGIEVITAEILPNTKGNYKKELKKAIQFIKPDFTIAVAGWSVDILPQLDDTSIKLMEFHFTKNFLVNFVKGIHSIRFRQLHLLKMYWLQWKLARTVKKYDGVVGLTKRDMRLWGNPSNMTYIYNPLSFHSPIKSTCENHRIIAVGSFTPSKGMDLLLKAFAKIAGEHKDWRVDIYGSGQDEDYLKKLIATNRLEQQVNLYRPVSDIGDRLVEASIYAFPSRSDGFGLVITEAMECGLPTVAFDCQCGPREIITDRTGIIVPEQDVDAFAQALERLIQHPSLRKKMGEAAATEVKRFYCDEIMPQWLNLFNQLKAKR